jgi:hypothetical protein
VYPGTQLQAVTNTLPFTDVVNSGHALQYADARTSMYVSTGHTTQLALPFVFLYFPSAHAVHGPPSAPSYPALHVQFVTSVAARSGSKLCAGHVVQASLLIVLFLYVPDAQLTQSVDSRNPITCNSCGKL